ncbi:hypothetical protein [Furfurilactobacillus siliginis]|uniref:Uncharacterized protein n=1 Tax=Furfurilactobacillus siliginis TaxID=348151 RepID=A0A510VVT6_9LACO|nr:hypothetical protein [Furfurilactobacillus siliginis]GEK28890.1 hypothetical protein LSI01_12010 [Furfurilactobacillus siliginis]
MTETEEQINCKFCHVQPDVKGFHGSTLYDRMEWWDEFKKTKPRKKVSVRITGLNGKRPKLQASIFFRFNPESLFNFKVNYCPKCGRKLGEDID